MQSQPLFPLCLRLRSTGYTHCLDPLPRVHSRQTVAELDYRHLFENGGVAQAIARLDGQFIACNTLFAELCGYATAA